MTERKYSRVYAVARFNIGDLVTAQFYGDDVFQIESYRIIGERLPGAQIDVIEYDLTRVKDGADITADDIDLTLVADASQSDAYIEANVRGYGQADYTNDESHYEGSDWGMAFSFDFGGAGKPKGNATEDFRKMSHRDREKQELARRSDYKAKAGEFIDLYNELKAKGYDGLANAVINDLKVIGVIHEAGGYTAKNEE
jgi:hypothetical protein